MPIFRTEVTPTESVGGFDEQEARDKGKSLACRYARNIHTDSEIVEIQVNSFEDGARWMHEVMHAENLRLREALNSIVAKSHSWVIRRETGHIEKPIHDSYRLIATEALEKVKG